ncbi:MAG: acyl-CoA dehydratase activase-related protein [Oscillospiraceae bacterium]|jgi:predicted CoA-substrate-specific enzyme activase|nr:acyl-CoA dehydratase activase-related protein [Oscillospiraceae bacterium]
MKKVGIDIGSTTVKVVVLSASDELLFRSYERHFSETRAKTLEQLRAASSIIGAEEFTLSVTGSAGLGVAKAAGLPFSQEVFATAKAVETYIPDADAVIELGGEDAKIIFFGGALEERMNGSCAGGTGAFIDQMASLLDVTVAELDAMSLDYEKIYPIASRCGVFAKSDLQPILNQGGRKPDLAASIYQAVVDQTVGGLAQGRELTGKIVFLGGPLTFLQGLRNRFTETLELDAQHAIFPDNADCFAAIGAALVSVNSEQITVNSRGRGTFTFDEVIEKLSNSQAGDNVTDTLPPLFISEADYKDFAERHAKANVKTLALAEYSGDAFLGIDAGSTTTKLCLITSTGELLWSYYAENKGNPVLVVLEQLKELYALLGERIRIAGSAVTGYGEELIKNAFRIDLGLVETSAHLKAAQSFDPNVDFLIDIGGQDMKCFKIRRGVVDGILLNEACSSGCGSFIASFAKVLGYDIADFAKLGLFDPAPVNLGSRCTVFMNSSVKQAQKDGAAVAAISAGLSISVVKNAIYKVIRAANADELGMSIVVQGGTFLNDAVLRAFERELGRNVVRPVIAGLMGAYGAALQIADGRQQIADKGILTRAELENFTHSARPSACNGCGNKCALTINTFGEGRRFISGNRCSKPLGGEKSDLPNMYKWKFEQLTNNAEQVTNSPRGTVGLPLQLNMLENLPFWRTLFTELGFEVITSPRSDRELFRKGQKTIPSDTVCYPAKLLHGHIEVLAGELLKREGERIIFYPCLPYNFDEKRSDNHYNCPVVAYYPELLGANVPALKKVRYLAPYVGLHNRKGLEQIFSQYLYDELGVPTAESKAAIVSAYKAYDQWRRDIIAEGARSIRYAREHGLRIIVLAGRPYHTDPEVNHGIDELISSLGAVVITEDAIAHLAGGYERRKVLNQWTFQARMYDAARYVTTQPDMQFVQLVSFGCGTDAITTDELRDILEDGGKLYTAIKIDEITNLGAVKIRLRSLFAALG